MNDIPQPTNDDTPFADSDNLVHEVEKRNLFRFIFVIFKILIIIPVLIISMKEHMIKTHCRKVLNVVKLNWYYIWVTVLLGLFDFKYKFIPLLFFILILAYVGQIMILHLFLGRYKRFMPIHNYKRIKCIFWMFYTAYALLMAAAILPTRLMAVCFDE